MEELSIEEKAKRYDEAIEIAKDYYKANLRLDNVDENLVLEDIFPELKESEDERTRKFLIQMAQNGHWGNKDWWNKCVSWLEKQGEKKQELLTKEKALKNSPFVEQKSAWSEEDENGLGDTLWAIKQARTIAKDENDMGNLWYAERWLKSLKDRVQPQNTWKPSDEQLDALQYVYRNCNPLPSDKLGYDSIKTLESMYHDLKKLKG